MKEKWQVPDALIWNLPLFYPLLKYTFPMKTRGEKYTFPMKIGAGNHTFLKKAIFYPYKTRILTHKLPFLVKEIFMEYCKVLLRDWKTLMTDNNLDLNDLIP